MLLPCPKALPETSQPRSLPVHTQSWGAHCEGVYHRIVTEIGPPPLRCPKPVRPPLPLQGPSCRASCGSRVRPRFPSLRSFPEDLPRPLYEYDGRAHPTLTGFLSQSLLGGLRPRADPRPRPRRLLPVSRPSSRVRGHTQLTPRTPCSQLSLLICKLGGRGARLCARPSRKAAGTGTALLLCTEPRQWLRRSRLARDPVHWLCALPRASRSPGLQTSAWTEGSGILGLRTTGDWRRHACACAGRASLRPGRPVGPAHV